MPAVNMPTPAQTVGPTPSGNPSNGQFVHMNPFSGPKNSPFDARTITSWVNQTPVYANDPNNLSTGQLVTGIAFGANHIFPATLIPVQIIKDAGFNDNYTPGSTFPSNDTEATDSRFVAIGGGRTTLVNGTGANGNGTPAGTLYPSTNMYNVQPLLGFGQGGARDAGAGPAFTGFPTKTVTAAGAVANGAAIEAGFVNRSGVAMVATQSAFGSSTTASLAVA